MTQKPDDWQARTAGLIGSDTEKLAAAHVLIVGLGGVGGYCFETLVRAGIGRFTIVDGDRVDNTNRNRQILADTATVGLPKTEAAKARAVTINPAVQIRTFYCRFDAQTAGEILDTAYDCAADAIDSVKDKVLLVTECKRLSIPIVSAMGAGNRLDDDFTVTDLYQTKYDGLARAMRTQLKKRGITALPVVASARPPQKRDGCPASISYPPAVAGCKLGGAIIRSLLA